jgi:putative ABC transport system permease protein
VTDVLHLAWQYLLRHRGKTLILIVSLTLIAYLPSGLRILVDRSARQLTARAEATPLLVGAKGSAVELVLNSLYFESETPELTTYADAERVADSGLALAVPLYVRFRVRDVPIVGTSLDYFEFRGLEPASGRLMATLGECVLGARAAERLEVGPGDAIVSSPETVFDLAGVYPLRMRVAGVLEPTETPDDLAVFVDVKTAWVIQGLGHGHQDMAAPGATGVLSRTDTTVTANASVVQYNEITEDNLDSFHFHGSAGGYPLSAVLAVPHDDKSRVILMGRYENPDDRSQIVEPAGIMDDLLGTVLTVRNYVVAAVALVGLSTLATAVLVFMLSLRIRRREIETMLKIGGSGRRIAAVLATEVVVVLLIAGALAGGLTALTAGVGARLLRALIFS